MQDYIDIQGVSGARYRFMRLKDGRPLSPMGGNYLYARFTSERLELVFVGEVQNLLKDARERWSEAQQKFGASDLYSRLNISERIRRQELEDILEATHPPMNPAGDHPS